MCVGDWVEGRGVCVGVGGWACGLVGVCVWGGLGGGVGGCACISSSDRTASPGFLFKTMSSPLKLIVLFVCCCSKLRSVAC